MSEASIIGILLAAGRGSRFDAAGARNKLLEALPDRTSVVARSAQHLLAVLPRVIAVVRPGQDAVAAQLHSLGCNVTFCANAGEGMAASLVHGLEQAQHAEGWIIALGDMPFVQPKTIQLLSEALMQGADIAAPSYQGRRGNPVGFRRTHLQELLQLQGDEGARRLLRTNDVTEIGTEDAGILQDIDTPNDLQHAKDLIG